MLTRAFLATFILAAPATAQLPSDSMTNAGVVRATAAVDSVFLSRTRVTDTIAPGDWAAYLMARLGVRPIPPDLRLGVRTDSSAIHITGRIADLPHDALVQLGPLLALFDTSTAIDAWASLTPVGSTAVRFRLDSAALGGVGIPEVALAPVLANVGTRFPALTSSGRDLYVAVPSEGRVELVLNGVRLVAPPKAETPKPLHHKGARKAPPR